LPIPSAVRHNYETVRNDRSDYDFFSGQTSAQQNPPRTGVTVVREPVFQTDGPYKVQEMMEPSLARHAVHRPIDLKAVKGKLPIVAFGNGGCLMIGNAFETYLTEIASYGFLFNANLDNVGHNGSLGRPFGGKMAQAARLWPQWQLKGDQEAGKAFVGPDCTLCRDPEWVVKKKNMK
jgi:hypothetical protein